MFRSLVRLLVSSNEGGESRPANSRSFTPRLESLDGRTMPSASPVSVGVGAVAAVVHSPNSHESVQLDSHGGLAGGVVANGKRLHAGGGAAGGIVGSGGLSGGVIQIGGTTGSIEPTYRSTGEEIPQM